MRPVRLSAADLADHLAPEPPAVRRIVRAVRSAILKEVPAASESIKFRALCYVHRDAWFGSIGGNIAMIEIKGKRVVLSFIHGVHIPDPAGLLGGNGKSKRFLPIPSAAFASCADVRALIRASAQLRPWDDVGPPGPRARPARTRHA